MEWKKREKYYIPRAERGKFLTLMSELNRLQNLNNKNIYDTSNVFETIDNPEVIKDNYNESAELTDDIKKFCEKSIAKYSMPYRYNYIKNVPKTLIGKVNFKKLEEECTRKYEKKNERATQNRI